MTAQGASQVTVRDRLSVDVSGLAGGGGELTWGQRFVWEILESLPPGTHYLNIRFRVHLPRYATRERVLSALATLLRRHEALRTRFLTGGDGEPRQQCDPAGQLPVEYCHTAPGHVRRLAEQEEERLWRLPFQNDRDWPMRVSVIAADGRPRQIVFVFSHLAVDAWACAVLRQEFLDLLRRDDALPAVTGWQPRERAAFDEFFCALPGGFSYHLHCTEAEGPFDLAALVSSVPPGGDLYACGPRSMLDALQELSPLLRGGRLHFERFVASATEPAAGGEFEIELESSGAVYRVGPGQSVLEVLRNQAIHLDFGCTEGLCGSCMIEVVSGEVDHRDSILSPEERASNDVMCACVSRAKSQRLVLRL